MQQPNLPSYRVLHVINSLDIGGAERLVSELIPKLNKDPEFAVDVLVLKKESTFFKTKLNNEGVAIFELSKTSVYSPLHCFGLRFFLKRYKLIHIHLIPSLYWVVLAKLLFGLKPKVIYTEHAEVAARRKNIILKSIDKFIYKKLDHTVAVSSTVAQSLDQHIGFTPLNVIENGIDLLKFKTAPAYSKSDINLKKTDFVILQVASLKAIKDHYTTLHALAQLDSSYKLILVGKGPEENNLKNHVKKLKLSNRVQFLGERDDVASLMACADVVVLTSKKEGFGLAVLEGMAALKPVITAQAQGLIQWVKGAALTFPIGDEQRLAMHIKALKNNKELYNKCVENGRLLVDRYDIDSCAEQHRTLYKKVINS